MQMNLLLFWSEKLPSQTWDKLSARKKGYYNWDSLSWSILVQKYKLLSMHSEETIDKNWFCLWHIYNHAHYIIQSFIS